MAVRFVGAVGGVLSEGVVTVAGLDVIERLPAPSNATTK
jgi:hypothetical protein